MHIFLEGQNINLRNVVKADAQSIYEYARDKDISRYTYVPYPYEIENALKFIRYSQQQIKKGDEYHLGIELKGAGHIIGMIGLMKISQENRHGEVGYWLGKRYWHRGYAADALQLMLEFGFTRLRLLRIWARVMHPNRNSARMLEKTGFVYEGCLRKNINKGGRWLDELRYGLLRDEFLK